MSNQLYQFLPYPENKPPTNGFYNCICRGPNGDPEKGLIHYHSDTGWKNGFYNDVVTHFLAPVPADPDDEKAAEEYARDGWINENESREHNYISGFTAGCAHKAEEVERLRKQLEESLLLYNNMTHNITTLNAENERLLNDLKNNIQKSRDLSKACDLLSEENDRLKADNANYPNRDTFINSLKK